MPLEFRVLGPVAALRDGEPMVLGSRPAVLLAMLLLRAGEAVPLARLVDDLWDEDPPETARNIVQGYISDLRKVLGRDVVETDGDSYSMRPPPGAVDIGRFEALVDRARGEEAVDAAETLRSALALWRGEPLVNIDDSTFTRRAAGRLEELRLLALERRIGADLDLGRHRDVVADLEELVAEYPLRESFCAQLMLALYRSGRQVDALAAYRAVRELLVQELGIEPGPTLRELEQAVLRQEPTLAERGVPAEKRSILVGIRSAGALEVATTIAEQLSGPSKAVVLAWPVGAPGALQSATAELQAHCVALTDRGVTARAAAFVSRDGARELLRLAKQQDAALLLVDGDVAGTAQEPLSTILEQAACDVAVLVARPVGTGPVLVPFVGARHDWAAVELGAWLARSRQAPLVLAGPATAAANASLLLANASLAVQRALGVAVQPTLVEPGPDALVRLAEPGSISVVGLPDRWRQEGIGEARRALAERSPGPVLLVRRGVRPGGLAPVESLTRFTWSLG
jgi:DNA-binding SARP family transcriptional activator